MVARVLEKSRFANTTSSMGVTQGQVARIESDESLFQVFTSLDYVADENIISNEELMLLRNLNEQVARRIWMLPRRHQKILELHYGFSLVEHRRGVWRMLPSSDEGMSIAQIGERFGVTREAIRGAEAEALRILRSPQLGLRSVLDQ